MTTSNDDFRVLGDSDELDTYQVVPYYVEGVKKRISVARIDGKLYAFDDLCPRDNCALSAGLLTGTTLMCQMAGCKWDITTGEVLRGPTTEPLGTYEVREENGQVSAKGIG